MPIYADKMQTSGYLRVGNTERQEESCNQQTEESGGNDYYVHHPTTICGIVHQVYYGF